MKKTILLLGALTVCLYSYSQISKGFYTPPIQNQPCISKEQYKELNNTIKINRERLIKEGKLQSGNEKSTQTVLLQWPLEANNGFNDYGYHVSAQFVDHDSTYPNQLLDYNCGNRTYDTYDGINHKGTDFALWPFYWYKMEHDQVKVVAAAAGTIIYKAEGNADHSCDGFNTAPTPYNGFSIQHADGSTAFYVHMKSGSLSNKTVGQTVVAGEYLGIVGSSGISTGPHLHFEVHDANDNAIDPFYGACNSTGSSSLWISQEPYYDSNINSILTLNAPSVFPTCPGVEISNEQTHFCSGQEIYFAQAYKDREAGQVTQLAVIKPDNSTWVQWNDTADSYYNASYWYYLFILPNNAPAGTWKYQVIFNGQTYERLFYVDVLPAISNDGSTLTVDVPSATYQWLDCNNGNAPILGETNQSYSPSQNGNYAVTVNQSTCQTDTASCFFLGSVNINDNKHLTTLTVYPNPSTGKFILDIKNLKLSSENTTISIYNTQGKRIYNSAVIYNNSANSELIDISKHPAGVYFMQISSESGVETIKILKY